MTEVNFSGFYKHSAQSRMEIIDKYLNLNTKWEDIKLPAQIGDQLIENYLLNYELPLGVAVNVQVNNKAYILPMAIEEPSVVAAMSNGAKILGNIRAETQGHELVGQIIFKTNQAIDKISTDLKQREDTLLEIARSVSVSMVKRGGGPRKLWVKPYQTPNEKFVSFYLSFDPCNAMGANAINTVLERLAPELEEMLAESSLMSILSNYQPESVTRAHAQVPVNSLHEDEETAYEIAEKIVDASTYASLDPYRATTHNKGVMNGVDAIVVATGNDWRAVEAGAHAYAAKDGQYRSLTTWSLNDKQDMLEGVIEIPLQVATVGGTLSSHPTARWALDLLQIEDKSELANVIASSGLIQNFSALRALVSDGIQKGHMKMQARSLAMQVGASLEEIKEVVNELNKQPRMNQAIAKEILNTIRQKN